ncbi:MAG: bepC 3, partial [Rhodospirillales bacterium]|nr:bepC 3 [Rhodospirillales bacterium]
THNLIKAAESDLAAAGERASAAYGGWYPSLNVRSYVGQENINKPSGTKDTSLVTREADFSVTQLLWDFGKTNSTVRSGELKREAARYGLSQATQELLLRAATSYLNVMRYSEMQSYALQSEDNIKKQSEIEDALVRRGAGLSTDVLNSKQQLAGAQARRVLVTGSLLEARNAYRAVFQRDVINIQNMKKPPVPLESMPGSAEDAVFVALRENPALKKAATNAADKRETAVRARSEGFTPTLNLVGERKFKHDVQGTVGRQEETLGKVEMSFPFNLGLTAVNTLKAANEEANADERRVGEEKDKVEQEARDAWTKFETMRMRLEYLTNQTEIAAEYLELARRERQAGTRTLNDILRAETDLINANSDAVSAEADFMIAVFSVLKSMGRLAAGHVMAVR